MEKVGRWTVPALIALLTFCLGFAASQVTAVNSLNALHVEVRHLKEEDQRMELRVQQAQQHLQQQIAQLSSLMERLINQNAQFIELLRVQNELLQRKP